MNWIELIPFGDLTFLYIFDGQVNPVLDQPAGREGIEIHGKEDMLNLILKGLRELLFSWNHLRLIRWLHMQS